MATGFQLRQQHLQHNQFGTRGHELLMRFAWRQSLWLNVVRDYVRVLKTPGETLRRYVMRMKQVLTCEAALASYSSSTS